MPVLKPWMGENFRLYQSSLNLINRKHRRRRDSTELKNNRYAVANSNDSGIGDKDSLDRVPGIKYLQGRRGSEGSESWV